MIHLTNEMENILPSIEQEPGCQWIQFRYPDQLAEQVKSYKDQADSGIKHPVISFEGSIKDNLKFVATVRFQVSQNACKIEKAENILLSTLS